jgi:hypothetical protein
METLQKLLTARGFNDDKVKLVRHVNKVNYDDQSRQGKPQFKKCNYIVSFTAEEGTKARFKGVFRKHKEWKKGKYYFYEWHKEGEYKDLENQLIIDWGKSQMWHQWFDKNEKKIIDDFSNNLPDLELKEYADGKIREELKRHKWRERNYKFVRDCKKFYSNIKICSGCGLDPKKKYGFDTIKFLDLHHIIPLSKKNPKIKLKLNDTTLLCPNCHRAIHKMMTEEDAISISLEDFKHRLNKINS